ncbi:MAG: hypothetical protein L6R37_000140 [Teloschistes peruensis]|nr:MAG: hypothetical protein L6R37_000140 [Teloschistes peruensis]
MSPFQPSLPISIRIRSIETANLSFVAKFRTPPFTLLFDTVNQTYRLEESADPTGRLLHHIGPYNLGYVAYCPGSEFVHTRSLDYVMKRKAKLDRGPEIEGGFVNLNCENGQEAEDLVTHFEERRMEWVKISRVSRARLDDMQAGRE